MLVCSLFDRFSAIVFFFKEREMLRIWLVPICWVLDEASGVVKTDEMMK